MPLYKNSSTKSKVHFISLGCARNMVDSEVMAASLVKEGYLLSHSASDSELIVVNTCGFIDAAKQESVDTILEAAQFKNEDKGVCKHLVVTGCLSERYPKELKESIPEVDLIMGTTGFSQIIDGLKNIDNNFSPNLERLKDYDLPRMNSQPFYTAYLKLAEGCAKRCSFCVIPNLRGHLRSRSIPMLVKETLSLVKSGVTEINLIAQDLTDYGRDRKDGTSLGALLKQLVNISQLKWIRLFYTYPDQLDDEVISLIKNEEKICNYLDVPVQHISDNVLKRMNRLTTGQDIENMIIKLKTEIPDLVLRTSLMVGFPEESEEEFQKLCEFVNKGYFEQIGVFTYSHEEGSASAKKFKDDISAETKKFRQQKIYEIQQNFVKRSLSNWQGKAMELLVEGPHDETPLLLKARHYGQGPGVDNHTLINSGEASVGDYVTAKITGTVDIDLLAEIIPSS